MINVSPEHSFCHTVELRNSTENWPGLFSGFFYHQKMVAKTQSFGFKSQSRSSPGIFICHKNTCHKYCLMYNITFHFTLFKNPKHFNVKIRVYTIRSFNIFIMYIFCKCWIIMLNNANNICPKAQIL